MAGAAKDVRFGSESRALLLAGVNQVRFRAALRSAGLWLATTLTPLLAFACF